jgi:alkanesulfonate monooxygenase SsuD/methylene tetrahydromethanopterin reductase-like flavin-dependent oxidoreductase (luciferase family)
VSFEGRYFSFTDMQASPRPLQQPHPPIWVGGNSPRARRRVAEFGDGWHATAMPFDELKAGIADARSKWARRGRPGEPVFSMRIPCSIEGVSQEILHYAPRRPGRDHLTGSFAAIVDRLGTYGDLGIHHLALEMSTQSHGATVASLEAFATRIRPQLGA